MSKKRFGDWVCERREELGLNQNQLAKKARVSRTTVNNVEANTIKHLKAETLFRLSKALEWDADQAMNAFFDKNPNDSTEKDRKNRIYQAAIEFLERVSRIQT